MEVLKFASRVFSVLLTEFHVNIVKNYAILLLINTLVNAVIIQAISHNISN